MNWADIAILSIIGISALLSLFRGFVREVLSLAAWVAAFWVAFAFTERGAGYLTDYISIPSARYVAAFVVLLVASLFVIGILNHLVAKLIDKTGLTGTDRMLGMVFGIVRGVAIVGVIVFLAGLTPVPRDPWWSESILMGHFQELALIAISFLPPDWMSHFSYS